MNPRQRTCKIKAEGCEGKYTPFNSLQACCLNVNCVLENKDRVEAKKHRKELRQFRERTKSRSDWTKEAQAAFNKWVRLRDATKPCISCDQPANATEALTGGYWDCGHYRSVGACPSLRFHPLNAHKQCKRCNSQLSGNVVEYRLRLIKRIGEEKLAWVEGDHPPKKYTIEQLQQLKAMYTTMAREIERRAA